MGKLPISPTFQFSWQEDTQPSSSLSPGATKTAGGGKACTSAFPEQVDGVEGMAQLEGGWDAPGPGRNSASCAVCLEEGRERQRRKWRRRGVWKVEVQREDTPEVRRFSRVLSKRRGTGWQVDLGSSPSSALNCMGE